LRPSVVNCAKLLMSCEISTVAIIFGL
jgi:hypothetical protein